MKTLMITKPGDKGAYTFCVDEPGRPGSPPVGYGETMIEALGQYLLNNQAYLGIYIDVDQTAQADEMKRREDALAER